MGVRRNLKNLINNFKTSDNVRKTQLTLKIVFRSSKDNGKERDMYFKSVNTTSMVDNCIDYNSFWIVFYKLSRKYDKKMKHTIFFGLS